MILDNDEIESLKRNGVNVVWKEEAAKKKTRARKEVDYLREIASMLYSMVDKTESAESKEIVVTAPDVVVNVPPPQPVRKWNFDVFKDSEGRTERIVATAMDDGPTNVSKRNNNITQ